MFSIFILYSFLYIFLNLDAKIQTKNIIFFSKTSQFYIKFIGRNSCT